LNVDAVEQVRGPHHVERVVSAAGELHKLDISARGVLHVERADDGFERIS
jgi:hypothetical protein